MRAVVLLGFLCGGLTMIAEADEKKDDPKKEERYPLTVTLKRYDPVTKKVPEKGVEAKARTYDVKGVVRFEFPNTMVGGRVFVGSEIVDKDGVTWKVVKDGGAGGFLCIVEKVEKKP